MKVMTGIEKVDSVPSVIRAIIEANRSHTHAMGLKSVLLGRDPTDVDTRWEEMYDATRRNRLLAYGTVYRTPSKQT